MLTHTHNPKTGNQFESTAKSVQIALKVAPNKSPQKATPSDELLSSPELSDAPAGAARQIVRAETADKISLSLSLDIPILQTINKFVHDQVALLRKHAARLDAKENSHDLMIAEALCYSLSKFDKSKLTPAYKQAEKNALIEIASADNEFKLELALANPVYISDSIKDHLFAAAGYELKSLVVENIQKLLTVVAPKLSL